MRVHANMMVCHMPLKQPQGRFVEVDGRENSMRLEPKSVIKGPAEGGPTG